MFNIEELEKMVKDACEKNDYELYKKACCLMFFYTKICPVSEEKSSYVLYDALCNEKSQDFLNIASEIVTGDKEHSCADIVVYALLLSVRTHSDFVRAFLIDICDDIYGELLNMLAEEEISEKRE